MARRRLSPAATVAAILLLPLLVPVWVLFILPPLDDPAAAQEKPAKVSEMPVAKPKKAPPIGALSVQKRPTPGQRPPKTSEIAGKDSRTKPAESQRVAATPPQSPKVATTARKNNALPTSAAELKELPVMADLSQADFSEVAQVEPTSAVVKEPIESRHEIQTDVVLKVIPIAEHDEQSVAESTVILPEPSLPDVADDLKLSPEPESKEPLPTVMTVQAEDESIAEKTSLPESTSETEISDGEPQPINQVADVELVESVVVSPTVEEPPATNTDSSPVMSVAKEVTPPLPTEDSPPSKHSLREPANKISILSPEGQSKSTSASPTPHQGRSIARRGPNEKPSGKTSYFAPVRPRPGIAAVVPQKPSSSKVASLGKISEMPVVKKSMSSRESFVAEAQTPAGQLVEETSPPTEVASSIPSEVVAQTVAPEVSIVQTEEIESPTVLQEIPKVELIDKDFRTLRDHMTSQPRSQALDEIPGDDFRTMREHFASRPEANSKSADVVQLQFDDQPSVPEPNSEPAASDLLTQVLADLVPVRSINVQRSVELPPVAETDSPAVFQPTDHARAVLGRRAPVSYAAYEWTPWQSQRDSHPFWHKPLYFEDPNLERCGRGWGVMTTPLSAGLFYGTIPFLPYRLTAEPPQCGVPTLPNCPTCQRFGADAYLPPWSWKAAAVQAGATVGLIYAVP